MSVLTFTCLPTVVFASASQVGKARHILSLGERLTSCDRPASLVSDPGIFSSSTSLASTAAAWGGVSSGGVYCSRSSLSSVSLSSSCLSLSSLPVGKPLRFAKENDPEKLGQRLLTKVSWLKLVESQRIVSGDIEILE